MQMLGCVVRQARLHFIAAYCLAGERRSDDSFGHTRGDLVTYRGINNLRF